MSEQVSNERENEPAIDTDFGPLTKAMQAKLMFSGFEKPFNRPAFAP